MCVEGVIKAVDVLEQQVMAAANEMQAEFLKQAIQLEQVTRQLKLAELSNSALLQEVAKHKRLSAVRLARAQKAEGLLRMNNIKPGKLTNREYKDA